MKKINESDLGTKTESSTSDIGKESGTDNDGDGLATMKLKKSHDIDEFFGPAKKKDGIVHWSYFSCRYAMIMFNFASN